MFPRYCQYVPVKMQVNQTEAALAINNCQRTKLFIGPYCRWEAAGTGVSRAFLRKIEIVIIFLFERDREERWTT